MDRLGPYLLGPNDTPENGIYTGDARELAKMIPDESIDLIFTDPPYSKEYLYLYEWLACEASRVLMPGGSCLSLVASSTFRDIFTFFDRHLSYHWLNCFYQPTVTQTGRYWPKQIYIRWKPVLWFTKGNRIPHGFVQDGVSGRINDKRFHEWGQDEQWAFYWINSIAQKGEAIWEPFCGGGTLPAICKKLEHQYLAFEIDLKTANIARERVRNTQPPLFVPEPQQGELEMIGV